MSFHCLVLIVMLFVMLFVLCLMTVSLWDCCLCDVFGQALLIMGIIAIMDNDWGIMNIEVIPTAVKRWLSWSFKGKHFACRFSKLHTYRVVPWRHTILLVPLSTRSAFVWRPIASLSKTASLCVTLIWWNGITGWSSLSPNRSRYDVSQQHESWSVEFAT
jgi:hypothetical protein